MSKLKYSRFVFFQARSHDFFQFSAQFGQCRECGRQIEPVNRPASVMDRVDRDAASVRTPARMQIAADVVRSSDGTHVPELSERDMATVFRIDQDQGLDSVLRVAVREDVPPVGRENHMRHPAVPGRESLREERAAALVEHDGIMAAAAVVYSML